MRSVNNVSWDKQDWEGEEGIYLHILVIANIWPEWEWLHRKYRLPRRGEFWEFRNGWESAFQLCENTQPFYTVLWFLGSVWYHVKDSWGSGFYSCDGSFCCPYWETKVKIYIQGFHPHEIESSENEKWHAYATKWRQLNDWISHTTE